MIMLLQDALIHVGHASLAKDNLAKSGEGIANYQTTARASETLELVSYNKQCKFVAGFHSVEVREYVDLEHWMCPQELDDVANFLKANLLQLQA